MKRKNEFDIKLIIIRTDRIEKNSSDDSISELFV